MDGLSPLRRVLRPRREAPLHLLDRHVLDVRRESPDVAERVLDAACAVAVELVGRRAEQLRAERDRARADRVDVLDVEVDRDRRPADRLRTGLVA